MTFNEIKNLPAGEFKLYWKAALDQQATEEGRQAKQAEVIEEEMTDGIM